MPHALNTLLVINSNSAFSREIANVYAAHWRVPAKNFCFVDWPLNHMGWSPDHLNQNVNNAPKLDEVEAHLLVPIQQKIDALPVDIDIILLCPDLPYILRYTDGAAFASQSVCSYLSAQKTATAIRNTYYSEHFGEGYTYRRCGQRIVFHMYGYNAGIVRNLIERARASDASSPRGTVYFQDCGEQVNNLRYTNSVYVSPEIAAMGVPSTRKDYSEQIYGNFAPKATDILGLLTGYGTWYTPQKPWMYDDCRFLPGAIADHLTSGAGRIDLWQDGWHFNINEYVNMGVAASYGCVDEPGGSQTRFPHPVMYLLYAGGYSLGETYYGGVQDNVMGCFLGDPLCAPFAVRPVITLSMHNGDALVSPLAVTASVTTQKSAGIGAITAYVDDTHYTDVSSTPEWTAGETIVAHIGDASIACQVPEGATGHLVATTLTNAINAAQTAVVATSGRDADINPDFNGIAEFSGSVRLVGKEFGKSVPYSVTGDANTQASAVQDALYACNTVPETIVYRFTGMLSAGDELHVSVQNASSGLADTLIWTSDGTWASFKNGLEAAINSFAPFMDSDGISASVFINQTGNSGIITLTARDVSDPGRLITISPRFLTSSASSFLTSPSAGANITLSGVPKRGDLVSLGLTCPNGQFTFAAVSDGTAASIADSLIGQVRSSKAADSTVITNAQATTKDVRFALYGLSDSEYAYWLQLQRLPDSNITSPDAVDAQANIYLINTTTVPDIGGISLSVTIDDQTAPVAPGIVPQGNATISLSRTAQPGDDMATFAQRFVTAFNSTPFMQERSAGLIIQSLSPLFVILAFSNADALQFKTSLTNAGATKCILDVLHSPLGVDGFYAVRSLYSYVKPYNEPQTMTIQGADGGYGLGRIWIAPGQPQSSAMFTLSPVGMDKGWHTLRVVAQDTSLAETTGESVVEFVIPSDHLPVLAVTDGQNFSLGSPSNINVTGDAGIETVELFAQGVSLGSRTGAGEIPTDFTAIGAGPIVLQAVGTAGGVKTRSLPVPVNVCHQTNVYAMYPQPGSGSGVCDTMFVAFDAPIAADSPNLSKIKVMSGSMEVLCERWVDGKTVYLRPRAPLLSQQYTLLVGYDFLDANGLLISAGKDVSWTPIAGDGLIFAPQSARDWSAGDDGVPKTISLPPQFNATPGTLKSLAPLSGDPPAVSAQFAPCYITDPQPTYNWEALPPTSHIYSYGRWHAYDVEVTVSPSKFASADAYARISMGETAAEARADGCRFYVAGQVVTKVPLSSTRADYSLRIVYADGIAAFTFGGNQVWSGACPDHAGTLSVSSSGTGACTWSGISVKRAGSSSARLSRVSGTVTLTDAVRSDFPLLFQFRPENGQEAFTRTQTLLVDGSFVFMDIPAGTYKVAVKGNKWLQKVVPLDATDDVEDFAVTLMPGDINGDNKVDITDLNALGASYMASSDSPHWNPNADLNCDGKVDIQDMGLLADAYNKRGDE